MYCICCPIVVCISFHVLTKYCVTLTGRKPLSGRKAVRWNARSTAQLSYGPSPYSCSARALSLTGSFLFSSRDISWVRSSTESE